MFGEDGKLMIIAGDHPARGALAAGGRATAMASRIDLLDRLRTALSRPGVDGLLATADIAEDLLLLGVLEDKLLFASMNRVASRAWPLRSTTGTPAMTRAARSRPVSRVRRCSSG